MHNLHYIHELWRSISPLWKWDKHRKYGKYLHLKRHTCIHLICRVSGREWQKQTLCRLTSDRIQQLDKSNEWAKKKNDEREWRLEYGMWPSSTVLGGISHMWSGYEIESVICISWNGTGMTNPCLCCKCTTCRLAESVSPNKINTTSSMNDFSILQNWMWNGEKREHRIRTHSHGSVIIYLHLKLYVRWLFGFGTHPSFVLFLIKCHLNW